MVVGHVDDGSMLRPLRKGIKLQGRTVAVEGLKARCLARVYEDRARRFDKLRGMDSVECIDMRDLVHEAIQQEYCHPKGEEDDASLHGWADEMLLVEEEILRELETSEAQEQLAALEAFEAAENDDICALYEQHQLGGVSCPLCHVGRLRSDAGMLLCTSCTEMQAEVMDPATPLDDVAAMLGSAEVRHRQAGCNLSGQFLVQRQCGPPLLYFQCASCGWSDLVL